MTIDDQTPRLSVVVPLFNEIDNLDRLVAEVEAALAELDGRFELICIDDGSSDGTFERLAQMADGRPWLRVARFGKNYGQTAAMSAGFHLARAEVVVTMDGDLQNDPADIPLLLAKIDEGFDIVSGWRRDRKDRFLDRTLPSRVANWLISRITGTALHDYGCTLKAYRLDVLRRFELYGQLHRFIPALGAWVGGRVTEVVVHHRARQRGRTKYGISRTFTVLLDLATVKFLMSYGSHPIRVFGSAGYASAFLGLVAFVGLVAMKLGWGIDMTGNPLLYLSMLGVIVAIQFLLMGILAEMVMRTYHEAQDKRPYTIVERIH
jgi:glycosyltransferase involved in cell wall biosynthesis